MYNFAKNKEHIELSTDDFEINTFQMSFTWICFFKIKYNITIRINTLLKKKTVKRNDL